MPVALTVLLAAGALAAAVIGLRDLVSATELERALADRLVPGGRPSRARRDLLGALERRLAPSRLVRWTADRAARAGVRARATTLLGASVLLFLTVVLLLAGPLPVLLALPLGTIAATGPYVELRRRQVKRSEAFIAQLSDLARLMSNATSAGRSLRSAIELAAEEMPNPAGVELGTVAAALSVGRPMADALRDLEARLPSRELSVLVGTLVISSRAGGSVVTALRNIGEMLDQRKEVRREVRTLLAQALASSYLVATIGIGILVVSSLVSPGLLNRMAAAAPGRLALIGSTLLFAAGFVMIRRIARIRV